MKKEHKDQVQPDPNMPAIAFSQVHKGFDSRKVLDDISFSIVTGETICILGRSGTGKSVALRLMIGLMKADSGTVTVMGEDVATLDAVGLSHMRRRMGFLFQSGALFDSFSVRDNLALPLRRLNKEKSEGEIKDAVEEALQQVGLEEEGEKMPSALSGGMQKRAGLARALVLQPQILLIDEPSSGLDRITACEINDLLLKIKTERHTTMAIVTHDIYGARRIGDKFVVLDETKLLAFGTPKELDERHDHRLNQFISEAGR
ncbi:Methionine ABC transporter ATP-binding protein [Acidisarcina polymorpha]|uniref:Methionine ABC transporter ATP-binding protein n=1 Tax=Acidisarcina polymorpha TaxID=2211140 RepID=A0A2Z5G3U0_9BACT|nr:ATP-binding cassette domain-containing protein [Acidisarcina polymorpha]AXC13802.1 Methionine ABC transporter ATP-binding protein [Acidisarcina polymorpha]